MSTTPNVLPSTLDGIKRNAKRIRRSEGITHGAALELAAKQCGYEGFQHARRALQSGHAVPLRHSVFLSAYWRDTSTTPRSNGLEVLEVKLPRPLLDFLGKHQCSYAQGLKGFFVEFLDHLEMRSNASSQQRAREWLERAAFALQFIEATGLRPTTTKVQNAAFETAIELPHSDHVSRWIHQETGGWLMIDEPYGHVTGDIQHQRRDEWVHAKGLVWAKPVWQGLYNPNQTTPFFVTNSPDLLERMVSIVESLPSSSVDWDVRSEPFNSQFVSPARELSGKKRKPRPGTTYGYSKNAIGYHWEEGWSSKLRPNQKMALDDHKEMGMTLKRLYVSGTPILAHSKLSELQSELENWMFAEYRGKNLPEVDVDVYYGGQDIPRYHGRDEMLGAVDHLRSIMVGTYLDSKPLRDQLKKLDAARESIAIS